jgi:flavin-binding protein dodecin
VAKLNQKAEPCGLVHASAPSTRAILEPMAGQRTRCRARHHRVADRPSSREACGPYMWISKISEIIGSSAESFEEAARAVVARAHLTLSGIRGIEVVDKSVKVENGVISEYRVRLRLIFDVAPRVDQHW